ncbi:MAG TPA: prepilin-type N-terminal cleavage/methylation domain-containing protein [Psychromonas sp.]
MAKTVDSSGFSLVEILVALLVVSLTAVNITGLQKMVVEQNRDNVAHTEVIALANKKMNELLTYTNVADIDGKDNVSLAPEKPGMTSFAMAWRVTTPDSSEGAGENVRNVNLQIEWDDAKGDARSYAYSEQVNLAQLLNPSSDDSTSQEAAIIESFLETNDVIYFEPKMGYKKGSFVIYNSELFEATAVYSVGNGHPRDVDNPSIVSEGWKSYGSIDNPELANNEELATLFLDPLTTTP